MASSYVLTKASRVFVLLLDDKAFLNDFDQTQGQNRDSSCFTHTKMKRIFNLVLFILVWVKVYEKQT